MRFRLILGRSRGGDCADELFVGMPERGGGAPQR